MNVIKENLLVIGVFLLVVLVAGYFFSTSRGTNLGAAFDGSEAKISTTSVQNLEAGVATVLFGTSTSGCTSRLVTTNHGIPVRLAFRDNDVPTATVGHLQAASTSVAYDSAIYGCGRWEAFSITAQAVTVSETVGK